MPFGLADATVGTSRKATSAKRDMGDSQGETGLRPGSLQKACHHAGSPASVIDRHARVTPWPALSPGIPSVGRLEPVPGWQGSGPCAHTAVRGARAVGRELSPWHVSRNREGRDPSSRQVPARPRTAAKESTNVRKQERAPPHHPRAPGLHGCPGSPARSSAALWAGARMTAPGSRATRRSRALPRARARRDGVSVLVPAFQPSCIPWLPLSIGRRRGTDWYGSHPTARAPRSPPTCATDLSRIFEGSREPLHLCDGSVAYLGGIPGAPALVRRICRVSPRDAGSPASCATAGAPRLPAPLAGPRQADRGACAVSAGSRSGRPRTDLGWNVPSASDGGGADPEARAKRRSELRREWTPIPGPVVHGDAKI